MIRAFRPINLLIIGLVCLAFQLLSVKIEGSLPNFSSEFLVYTLAAILVGAAGYLTNGFYDREIDKINHNGYEFPFSKNQTYIISLSLIIVALSLGLAFFTIKFTLGFILFPIVALWLYSAALKKTLLFGNALIAFISFWLPVGLLFQNGILEHFKLENNYSQLGMLVLVEVFLISFAREIIKDIQDIEGDRKGGCKTLPILFNEKVAAIFATGFLMLGSLIWFNVIKKYFDDLTILSMVFAIMTFAAVLVSIFLLWLKKDWKTRTKLSSLTIKIGMLTALLTLIFI